MIYKVSDFYSMANQLKQQGYKEVEITLYEAEDDLPERIEFSVKDRSFDFGIEDFGEIESIKETF